MGVSDCISAVIKATWFKAREAVRDAQDQSGWGRPPPRTLSPQITPLPPPEAYYLPYRSSLVTRIVKEVFFPPPTPSND